MDIVSYMLGKQAGGGGGHSTYYDLNFLYVSEGQYITTNILPTSNIQVEIKFASAHIDNRPLFGTDMGGDYYHVALYNNKYYWGVNNSEKSGGSIAANIMNQHTVIFNNSNSQVIVDNNNIGTCSGASSTKTLNFFIRPTNPPKGIYDIHYYIGRVYYIIVTDKSTNTELLHLVPKLRFSDNVIGFLDILTNTFLTNEGTGGSFTIQ